MGGIPLSSHAADVHDSGYVSIGVPDLQQATAFFRSILDCEPISLIAANQSTTMAASGSNGHTADHDQPASRLLLCDAGTVVELFDDQATHDPAHARHTATHAAEPIQFYTGDVANAGQWLRREGVTVIGPAVIVKSGPHAGQTLVNFVAPWGLSLQLVGWNRSQVATTP